MKEKLITILQEIICGIKNKNYDNIMKHTNSCFLDTMILDSSVLYYDFSDEFGEDCIGLGDVICKLKNIKNSICVKN